MLWFFHRRSSRRHSTLQIGCHVRMDQITVWRTQLHDAVTDCHWSLRLVETIQGTGLTDPP